MQLDEVRKKREEWEKTVHATLKKTPELKEEFITDSGIPVKRIYTPEDIKNLDYLRDLGFPGEYPYTRGVYPTMYRGKTWTIRQVAGLDLPEDTRERFKYLLDHGETGVSIVWDKAAYIGYEEAERIFGGDCYTEGAPTISLEDMEYMFGVVPLDKMSVSLITPHPALLAMFIVVGERQGLTPDKLTGTLQCDPLQWAVQGGFGTGWFLGCKHQMRLFRDILVYCTHNMPRFHVMSISGYNVREAGENAVQEIAFAIANGMAYVETGINAGLNVDDFAPRISFFFGCSYDFFEEIAKFRAGRRLWVRIMKEKYGAKNPLSWQMRFHVQTSGASLTAQQPENNIVRVAIQALAAVLGGCQSLHTDSYDEAWHIPSEKAVRIALRTQQIIAEETGVVNTIDPLGGSYYVEWLTNRMEEEAQKYLDEIDALGGTLAAIEKGFFLKEILRASYESRKRVEKGDKVIVGLNKYRMKEEIPITAHRPTRVRETYKELAERERRYKKKRDNKRANEALDKVRRVVEKDDAMHNIMPSVIEAVKAGVTLGELSHLFAIPYSKLEPWEIAQMTYF